jgi:hypothetical protein
MTGQICRDGPGDGPSLGAARFASPTSAKKSPNLGDLPHAVVAYDPMQTLDQQAGARRLSWR